MQECGELCRKRQPSFVLRPQLTSFVARHIQNTLRTALSEEKSSPSQNKHYCPRLSVRVRPLSVLGLIVGSFVPQLRRFFLNAIMPERLLNLQTYASRSPPAPVVAPFRVGRALLGLLLLKENTFPPAERSVPLNSVRGSLQWGLVSLLVRKK